MKIRSLFCLALCTGLWFPGAKSRAEVFALGRPVSAEKNSFKEVTEQLDPGGTIYVYLSTENWLRGLSGQVSSFRDLALASKDTSDRANINHGFDLLARLIKRSGIEDVSGVGISSVRREKGLFHNKFFLHHYPGQGEGKLLWTAYGKAPHELTGFKLLPANTAVANFSDFDLAEIWAAIREEVNAAGAPEWKGALDQAPAFFQMGTGLSLDQVLASLDKEMGLVVTLDPSRKMSVPTGAGGGSVELPEPALALVLRVKDDVIFNRVADLAKGTGQVISVDQPVLDLRMRTVPAPNPYLTTLRPTIARSGPYLILATSDGLVQEMVSALRGGKHSFTSLSEEYKSLAADIPVEGNQFQFMGKAFTDAVSKIQRASLQAQAGQASDNGTAAMLEKFSATGGSTYSVGALRPDGWLVTGNGTQDAAKMLAPMAVVPVAIAAGMALPAFTHTRENAQEAQIVANLRQIDSAKSVWARDNNKKEGAPVTQSDLAAYLGHAIHPVAGETYQVNPIGTAPTATLPAAKSLGGKPGGAVITLPH